MIILIISNQKNLKPFNLYFRENATIFLKHLISFIQLIIKLLVKVAFGAISLNDETFFYPKIFFNVSHFLFILIYESKFPFCTNDFVFVLLKRVTISFNSFFFNF